MQLTNIVSALALSSLATVSAQSSASNTVVQNVAALNTTTASGKPWALATAYKLAASAPGFTDQLSGNGNVTLFAPTDSAFAAVNAATLVSLAGNTTALQSALAYHVLQNITFTPAGQPAKQFVKTADGFNWIEVDVATGNKVTLFFSGGNATVVDSIPSSNGIIHVIDNVLTAPPSVIDVAKAAGLDTLVAQAQAANLTDSLANLTNATVFAPTNAAFDTLTTYAKSNNISLNETTLSNVLKFHVIPGAYFSTDIAAAKTLQLSTLLEGQNVTVTQDGDAVHIVGAGQTALKLAPAQVKKADVLINGGVAHIIDAVLVPDLTAAANNGSDAGSGSDTGNGKSSAASVSASIVGAAFAAAGALALMM